MAHDSVKPQWGQAGATTAACGPGWTKGRATLLANSIPAAGAGVWKSQNKHTAGRGLGKGRQGGSGLLTPDSACVLKTQVKSPYLYCGPSLTAVSSHLWTLSASVVRAWHRIWPNFGPVPFRSTDRSPRQRGQWSDSHLQTCHSSSFPIHHVHNTTAAWPLLLCCPRSIDRGPYSASSFYSASSLSSYF